MATSRELDWLLFASEADVHCKQRKREQAQAMLGRIYNHKRRQKRLHLYNQHEADDPNMADIGYALLNAVVSSMELDAEITREQKANRRAANVHAVRDPQSRARRACLSDQRTTTKYPARCKPWEHEDFLGEIRERFVAHSLEFDFPSARERQELRHMLLGLQWELLPDTTTPAGTEIASSGLSSLLAERWHWRSSKKIHVTLEQLLERGVAPTDLRHDSFVRLPWSIAKSSRWSRPSEKGVAHAAVFFRPAGPRRVDFEYLPLSYTDPAVLLSTSKEARVQNAKLGRAWCEVPLSGLLWRRLGTQPPSAEPSEGQLELHCRALSTALMAANEAASLPVGHSSAVGDAPAATKSLSRAEWTSCATECGLGPLRSSHYVQAGPCYWQPVVESPAEGKELFGHEAELLAAALGARSTPCVEFTADEWMAFGIAGLCCNSFVRVGGTYFRPDMPRNPLGRTGIQGRGKLSSWGRNDCVDYIITRTESALDEEAEGGAEVEVALAAAPAEVTISPKEATISSSEVHIGRDGNQTKPTRKLEQISVQKANGGGYRKPLKVLPSHGDPLKSDGKLLVRVGKAADGKPFEALEKEWLVADEDASRLLPRGRQQRAFLGAITYALASGDGDGSGDNSGGGAQLHGCAVPARGASEAVLQTTDSRGAAPLTSTRSENGLLIFDVEAGDDDLFITALRGPTFHAAGCEVRCCLQGGHTGHESTATSWALATSGLADLPRGGGWLSLPIHVRARAAVGIMISCAAEHHSRGVLQASNDVMRHDERLLTLGLTWFEVGETPPMTGDAIDNDALAKALATRESRRVELTREELRSFRIREGTLQHDSWIKAKCGGPWGLRWRYVGSSQPASGREVHHKGLERRLQAKQLEFTAVELEALGLADALGTPLEPESFVKVLNVNYFDYEDAHTLAPSWGGCRSHKYFQVMEPRDRYFKPDYTAAKSQFLAERRPDLQCGIPGGAPALGSNAPPEAFIFGWKVYALMAHVEERIRDSSEDASVREQKLDRLEALWKHMKDHSQAVHSGYVEDPRNTDNAWFEATVYHMSMVRLRRLTLPPPDESSFEWNPVDEFDTLPKECADVEAGKACRLLWLEMNRLTEPRYETLFETHRKHLDLIDKDHPHRRAGLFYRDLGTPCHRPWHTHEAPAYEPIETPAQDAAVEPSREQAMAEMASVEAGVLARRGTYEFVTPVAPTELPRNPWGSTGFAGRGKDEFCLKYGVNHCVDMIITRQDPSTHEWQVCADRTCQGRPPWPRIGLKRTRGRCALMTSNYY